jgi:hypothetical protein
MRRSPLHSSARILAVLFLCLAASGCDESVEGFVDLILSGTGFEKVNVANGTDRTVTGSFVVTDPTGREVLADSFRLEPDKDGGFQVNLTVEDEPALATYDATFQEAGTYSVSLELDEPIGGTRSFKKTVALSDPEKQRVLVVLSSEEETAVQVVRLPNPEEDV